MADKHEIRRATPDDLAAVLEIAAESPGAPQWATHQYKGILRASIHDDTTRLVLIGTNGPVVTGFCITSAVADQAELESIAVTPAERRKGLAKALLLETLAWVAEKEVKEVWLEVRESNEPARVFYRSIGFEEAGIRYAYYSKPKENAILMRAFVSGATHL